jgi:hypothetical protein
MSETITQINTMQDGTIVVGEYPDAAIQATIDTQNSRSISDEANFRAVVDLTNMNDRYTDVLTLANKYFTDQGLEPAPLRVINRETLHRAYAVAGTKMRDKRGEAEGSNVNGRALIIENQQMNEMFGEDAVLGIALHEAAHSLGRGEHLIRTVAERENRIALGGIAIDAGSLGKADLRKGTEVTTVGNFWEEAFADLTRVRALRALRRTHDIDESTNPFEVGGVMMMGVPNESDIENPGIISLPAEFAMLSKTISEKNYIAQSASNFAAYALELLDRRVSGLYEDLLAARKDPVRQREAIKKINSVQPGLYKQLRDMEYTDEDFVEGLKVTLQALEGSELTQKDTA